MDLDVQEIGDIASPSKWNEKGFKKVLPIVLIVVGLGVVSFMMKKKTTTTSTTTDESNSNTVSLSDNQKTDIENELQQTGALYTDLANQTGTQYATMLYDFESYKNQTNETIDNLTDRLNEVTSVYVENQGHGTLKGTTTAEDHATSEAVKTIN